MKRVIQSITIISAVFLFGTFSSCKKMFDNMAKLNVDEVNPTKATPASLLAAAQYSGVMANQGGFGDGFIGIFAQHFAGNHATGVEYNIYNLTNRSSQGLFNNAYVSSLMNLRKIEETANTTEQAYVGIAKILIAYQLGYLTTLYGDIPWSETLDASKNLHPKYDSQVEIYAAVQKLLADAVPLLDKGGEIKGDIIYGGDLDKWKAADYLLSARFYNHFSKKDPQGSATSALGMVDKAKAAGLTSPAGDFVLPYSDAATTTINNPWFSMYTNGMVITNVVFLNKMMADEDPRIHSYFTSTNGVGKPESVYGKGKAISGVIGTGKYMGIGPDDYSYFGKKTSNVLMATYCELLMIEAEAAFRSNNKSRAATAHNKAVQVHLTEIAKRPVDAAKIPAYIAKYGSETEATITLEKIMTEKHKLMLTMEVESWMDVRRHDNKYPASLTIPVEDETIASPKPVAANFIQRLLYPQSELDRNEAAVPKNVTLFTKLPILQ